ncbi:MAG: BatA and WFA domain-containing protein [Tepidisphaerales bacterium]
MTLVHPWAILAGIAAATLPLIIHWLTKPRPTRVALSTIRFLMEVIRQRRARHRLRDAIVLLCRIAAVLLLAAAFARPLTERTTLASSAPAGDTTRVVVLDCSQSMAAVSNGIGVFERGRPVAAEALAGRPGLAVNLILAGAKPLAVFDQPSSNVGALREELAKAQPRPEQLDLQAAIANAGRMLAASPGQHRRELLVISDLQRSTWATADFSPLPQDTVIQLRNVAPATAPANLAILRVAPQGRVEQDRETRIEVDVGNYSPATRELQVELSIGAQQFRLSGTCPPNSVSTLATNVTLPQAGWVSGAARLVNAEDALPADNSRSFVIDIRPMPVFAMVSRQPAKPHAASSHYLERALLPLLPKPPQAGGKVVRLDPAQLDRDAIIAADLIVLDHPGHLTQPQVTLLASLVRRGKALLYVAADPIDASNLKMFAQTVGGDLQLPVEFLPPEPKAPRRDLFILEQRANQSPFNAFGETLPAVLSSLRFGGGLASRRLTTGLEDDLLAVYSDRSACLVVSACGAGSLAVLNADLDQSNLPNSSAFVPLVEELGARLLGQRRSEDTAVPSGQALARYLPADVAWSDNLTLTGPKGVTNLGQLRPDNNFILWKCDSMGPPGIYRVLRGEQTVFAVAAAVPPGESDLRSLDPQVLKNRLAGGRKIDIRSLADDPQRHDTVWAWCLVACAVFLLLELLTLKLFRT